MNRQQKKKRPPNHQAVIYKISSWETVEGGEVMEGETETDDEVRAGKMLREDGEVKGRKLKGRQGNTVI